MISNRLAQRLARALMALGLGVGVLGMGLWLFDIEIDIPAWMWRVAIVKLTLAGAVGMLVTGAALLRYLRRVAEQSDSLARPAPNEALPAPPWVPPESVQEREADAIRSRHSRRTP